MTAKKTPPTVSIQYRQTDASTKANERCNTARGKVMLDQTGRIRWCRPAKLLSSLRETSSGE